MSDEGKAAIREQKWQTRKWAEGIREKINREGGVPRTLNLHEVIVLAIYAMDNNNAITIREMMEAADDVTEAVASLMDDAVELALREAWYAAAKSRPAPPLRRPDGDGGVFDKFQQVLRTNAMGLARREGASAVAALLASHDMDEGVRRVIAAAVSGQDTTGWTPEEIANRQATLQWLAGMDTGHRPDTE